MTKDTITASDSSAQAKAVSSKTGAPTAAASKPGASKPKVSKPKNAGRTSSAAKASMPKASTAKPSKPKAGKPEPAAKTASPAPSKAAVKKVAKAATKAATKAKVSGKSTKKAPVKPVAEPKDIVPATPSFGRSLQAAVPAAVAVNTKLVDIAHSNVSAGLELARDLAGAKTPMEAMRLGVAYWFNHMGAVQAQARELQSLSAAWVQTASGHVRTL